METVKALDDIVSNVLTFHGYRNSTRAEERKFYSERIRLGKIFVALPSNEGMLFCPSRFAGYKFNTREKHIAFEYKSGSVTTPRITSVLGLSHEILDDVEKKYLALCTELQITPSKKERSYWLMQRWNSKITAPTLKTSAGTGYPDDIDPNTTFPEGPVKHVTVNAYERSPKARKACIDYYGTNCAVCEMSFETVYGEIGKGFIHVHHLQPIALRNAEYEVDPIKDMMPVCPNCHAMLHRSDPPFTINELRELLWIQGMTNKPNNAIQPTLVPRVA